MHFARLISFLAAFGALSAAATAAPTLSLPAPAPGTTTTTPNKISNQPWLSTDGRYLTFASNASNLITGFTDNNEASQGGGASDLYQRDLQTGTITLITHAAGSTTAGMNSRTTGQMRASDDGRYVFFVSDSTDLVTGRGGAQRGYVWDRNTGASTLYVDLQCGGGTMSADGNWIAVYITAGGGHTMPKNVFDSSQGTHNSTTRYAGYLINRATGAVTLMTHDVGSASTAAATDVQSVLLSADGRYCAFECGSVVSGWDSYTGTYVTNSEALYVYDRQGDAMALVTKTNGGAAPSVQVLNPSPQSISADGRYVYFNHGTDVNFGGAASNDANGVNDTFRYDRDAAANSRVLRLFFDVFALSPNVIANTVNSSPNNRYLAFLSPATNLVSGDTNGRSDLFRYDSTTATVERINVNADGSEWTAAANGTFVNSFPRVNDSGNVIFVSTATGLGFTDSNAAADIFLATFSSATAPTVASPSKASIATTSATLGGNITADGGATITERGIVYAVTTTNNNPQIGGSGVTKVAASGTSTGAFTTSVTGLTAGTGYSFKAYATNSAGTGYTSADTFTTSAADVTPPTIVSIVRQSPAAQTIADGTTSFTFRVTYSEAVQGVATGEFQIEAVSGSNVTGSVDSVTGAGTTRDVTVTLTGGFGEFRLKAVN